MVACWLTLLAIWLLTFPIGLYEQKLCDTHAEAIPQWQANWEKGPCEIAAMLVGGLRPRPQQDWFLCHASKQNWWSCRNKSFKQTWRKQPNLLLKLWKTFIDLKNVLRLYLQMKELLFCIWTLCQKPYLARGLGLQVTVLAFHICTFFTYAWVQAIMCLTTLLIMT